MSCAHERSIRSQPSIPVSTPSQMIPSFRIGPEALGIEEPRPRIGRSVSVWRPYTRRMYRVRAYPLGHASGHGNCGLFTMRVRERCGPSQFVGAEGSSLPAPGIPVCSSSILDRRQKATADRERSLALFWSHSLATRHAEGSQPYGIASRAPSHTARRVERPP